MKRVVVIGLGNRYRMDDGVGPCAIDRLRSMNLPEHVTLVDAGMDELTLIEAAKEADLTFIIDAVTAGGKAGELYRFSGEKLESIPPKKSYDTHAIGLLNALRLMKKLNLCTDVTVLGVEPQKMEHGDGLSERVETALGKLTGELSSELRTLS